jgi:DNA-binding XRE family transcriptional regulator
MANKAKHKEPTTESLRELPELDFSTAKVLGRGLKAGRGARLPLSGLRAATGKTQVEMAAAADVAQSEISRIESRGDVKLSTLRRYLKALGAELELVAVFKTGHRIGIEV